MNGRHPTPDSRFGHLQARLNALLPAQEQATADLAKTEQAVTTLLAGRRRPPRELRRLGQRDRDRADPSRGDRGRTAAGRGRADDPPRAAGGGAGRARPVGPA